MRQYLGGKNRRMADRSCIQSWYIVADARLMIVDHYSITIEVICALVDKNPVESICETPGASIDLRNHGEMRRHFRLTLRRRLAALYFEDESIHCSHLDPLGRLYGLFGLSEGLTVH